MRNVPTISRQTAALRRIWRRALVLAALLTLVGSLGALAATHTVNTDSRVYRSPDLSSQYVALPKGMQVNLVATNNGWAMIENAGIYGYTNAAHLTENAASEAPQPAVITEDTYVFQSPDLNSARLSVPKGMRVELIAVNGDWAMVRNGSVYAYMYAPHVSPLDEAEPAPTATPEPTAAPVYEGEPAVITANTYVFQSPDLNQRAPERAEGDAGGADRRQRRLGDGAQRQACTPICTRRTSPRWTRPSPRRRRRRNRRPRRRANGSSSRKIPTSISLPAYSARA